MKRITDESISGGGRVTRRKRTSEEGNGVQDEDLITIDSRVGAFIFRASSSCAVKTLRKEWCGK